MPKGFQTSTKAVTAVRSSAILIPICELHWDWEANLKPYMERRYLLRSRTPMYEQGGMNRTAKIRERDERKAACGHGTAWQMRMRRGVGIHPGIR